MRRRRRRRGDSSSAYRGGPGRGRTSAPGAGLRPGLPCGAPRDDGGEEDRIAPTQGRALRRAPSRGRAAWRGVALPRPAPRSRRPTIPGRCRDNAVRRLDRAGSLLPGERREPQRRVRSPCVCKSRSREDRATPGRRTPLRNRPCAPIGGGPARRNRCRAMRGRGISPRHARAGSGRGRCPRCATGAARRKPSPPPR